MRTTTDKTIVIFRIWKDTGDVIALFPRIPSDLNGWYCQSYMHIGQHGGADFDVVMRATRPASRRESLSLRRELRQIGYRLTPVRRTSHLMHQQRRADAEYIRTTAET
jgi:hypothetical protein